VIVRKLSRSAKHCAHLSHVSGCIRVLSSEYGTNTVNPFPATGNLELLVELRRLCQESLLLKVRQLEDIRTTFGRSTDQARRMEFLESMLLQVFAEKILYRNSNIGNCLTNWSPLMHSRIIEMRS
jgi:hypothetical protein